MAEFNKAVNWLLRHEGGWSDNPNDRGGKTRYGIIEEVATKYGYDVRTITIAQAKAIYRAKYWRFDGFESQRVATKALDMAANMGPEQAIKLLQRAANAVLLKIQSLSPEVPRQLVDDGMVGPTTDATIDWLCIGGYEHTLLDAIVKQQGIFYAHVVNENAKKAVPILRRADPKFKLQAVFTLGWIDRAFDVPE